MSNRISSFTICNQVTEAWLAPFVGGVYFVLCLIWKTGAGLCGGRSHIHPMKLQFNIHVFLLLPVRQKHKAKRLNFSSSQENGIIMSCFIVSLYDLFYILIYFSFFWVIFSACRLLWVGSVSVAFL